MVNFLDIVIQPILNIIGEYSNIIIQLRKSKHKNINNIRNLEPLVYYKCDKCNKFLFNKRKVIKKLYITNMIKNFSELYKKSLDSLEIKEKWKNGVFDLHKIRYNVIRKTSILKSSYFNRIKRRYRSFLERMIDQYREFDIVNNPYNQISAVDFSMLILQHFHL